MPSPGLRSPQHSLHSPSSVASAAAAWVAALAASPEDEGEQILACLLTQAIAALRCLRSTPLTTRLLLNEQNLRE